MVLVLGGLHGCHCCCLCGGCRVWMSVICVGYFDRRDSFTTRHGRSNGQSLVGQLLSNLLAGDSLYRTALQRLQLLLRGSRYLREGVPKGSKERKGSVLFRVTLIDIIYYEN